MRAKGRIDSLESTIEDIVRRISKENDQTTERLARELGRYEEREKRLSEQLANLTFERNNLRERKAARSNGRSRRRVEVA